MNDRRGTPMKVGDKVVLYWPGTPGGFGMYATVEGFTRTLVKLRWIPKNVAKYCLGPEVTYVTSWDCEVMPKTKPFSVDDLLARADRFLL